MRRKTVEEEKREERRESHSRRSCSAGGEDAEKDTKPAEGEIGLEDGWMLLPMSLP